MERYAPNKLELASRDVVARAEQTEINEGRGFEGGTVALDITKVPRRRTLQALREIVNIGRDFAGVDITREPILIRPGMHYLMGGVRVDVDGAASVPGLYAAGETACVSCHGANRLGGNSLLDTLVFGARAGRHAAARASEIAAPVIADWAVADAEAELAAIGGRERCGPKVFELREQLGRAMHEHVGVFREAAGLAAAQAAVDDLVERSASAWVDDTGAVFNQDLPAALELGFSLDVARAIAASAAARTESRGSHSRTDFPQRDDANWMHHLTVRRGDDGRPVLGQRPVTVTRWEPQERTY
jgi:succinate dehydrogenase / fumarate reductase flavoprotein subunit